jgi:hypothetical protein
MLRRFPLAFSQYVGGNVHAPRVAFPMPLPEPTIIVIIALVLLAEGFLRRLREAAGLDSLAVDASPREITDQR